MNNNINKLNKGDILIVDDIQDNLRLLFTMLTEQGYEVRRVINGQQALNAVKSDPPELILLDIMMPEMDGYEVCSLLKASEATREIPIIFLSAKDEAIDKVKAFKIGAVDYITKPCHVEEVVARVETQLTIARQRKQLAKQNIRLQQEICDRQKAEDQLQQLNAELVRSNQELEQFAYIVSHDLQQPLTTIHAFAQLIIIKFSDEVNENAKRYVTRILETSIRMQQLIQDLLTYSRLGTRTSELKPVDCNVILNQVLVDLQGAIAKHKVVVTYDSLPTVMGDEIQLAELFQNLITNAIKYSHPQIPPEIKISVTAENNKEWIFGVQDNGIGIDPKHFDRIFEIFQRLHTSSQYSGTGIGLAICKKIMDRHGGRIWVDSKPGCGTTFYFTLPML